MNTARATVILLVGSFWVALSAGAQVRDPAPSFPSRPIRWVVPVPIGGTNDILSRLFGPKIHAAWGQQVIVDNRPGGAFVIGSDIVAKGNPDGHTVGTLLTPHIVNPFVLKDLPYDTLRDFTPVILAASTPNVLVVHPSMPVRNVRDFVVLAKRRPNEIAYASSGVGGASYLATEMFKLETGIKMIHVPYKGTAPALTAILSGEVQAMIAALPGTVPNLKAGQLRALGVTSAKRASAMPELPTLIESGIKGFEFATWYGLFAPGGVSRDIVTRLNTSINKILAMPDVKAQFERQGLEPAGGSTEEFARYFKGEIEKLGKVIRASGAKVE